MSIKLRRDRNAVAFFNDRNGDKLRIALGRYRQARLPELVDLKITDYCPFGCAFCYQDSTTAGRHASMENVRRVVAMLAAAGVFEVAIGGGEPTTHPEFVTILREFRAAGLVPNFTTKSLGWVKQHWRELDEIIGAFAFSCETAADVVKAAKSFDRIDRSRVNLHYVMGLEDEAGFVAFMRAAARLPGDAAGLQDRGAWPGRHSARLLLVAGPGAPVVEVGACPTFSIDTPLAAEYQDVLPIPRHQFHTREGFVSAYIDVVRMGLSASSFENQRLVPIADGDLEAAFARA